MNKVTFKNVEVKDNMIYVNGKEFAPVYKGKVKAHRLNTVDMIKAINYVPNKTEWAEVFDILKINNTYRTDMGYGRIFLGEEKKHMYIVYAYAKEIIVCVPNKRREEFNEKAPEWVTKDRWVEHKNWSPNPYWLHCTPQEFLELLAI